MCATSIGSTFAHSPLPGERKSGIPDGTEIPAPVNATTDVASRISEASCSTLSAEEVALDTPERLVRGGRAQRARFRPSVRPEGETRGARSPRAPRIDVLPAGP